MKRFLQRETTEERSIAESEIEEERQREETWRGTKAKEKVIVASMDVVGLYPNLNIARSAEEVGREVEGTSLKFMNVDYHLAGRFIASNMSQEAVERDGLGKIVPGSTTAELYNKRLYGEEGEELERESKWKKI